MIANSLNKLYGIKCEIKSALEFIGQKVDDVFSSYPAFIKPENVESVFAKYFIEGPEIPEGNGYWKTLKCIFDTNNEHLMRTEFVETDLTETVYDKEFSDGVDFFFEYPDTEHNVCYIESFKTSTQYISFKTKGYSTYRLPMLCQTEHPGALTVKIYIDGTEYMTLTPEEDFELGDYDDFTYTDYDFPVKISGSEIKVEYNLDSGDMVYYSRLAVILPTS